MHLSRLKPIRACLTSQDLSSNTKFSQSQSRDTLPLIEAWAIAFLGDFFSGAGAEIFGLLDPEPENRLAPHPWEYCNNKILNSVQYLNLV